MNLLESYDKNKKKHSLDEVSAATAVSGFTGRGGQLVDQLFSGGFHPEFGNLKKLLVTYKGFYYFLQYQKNGLFVLDRLPLYF